VATTGETPPVPPGLHLIATPIGNLRDITLRALDVLQGVEVLAAEDTRSLRRLMDLQGVALRGRPLVAYHDHNGPAARPRLLAALAEGRSVAYASEAGTPLVADPGYQLARAAIEAGHPVFAAPGPSAVLAALSVSGLPTDRFLFAGFPPPKASARRRFLQEIGSCPATAVLFESPKRVRETLADLVQIWGGDRPAALCRELTKRFEDVRRGTLAQLLQSVSDDPPRGEIVLVIDRAPLREVSDEALDAALLAALGHQPLREAVQAVAAQTGLPRRRVYQAALRLEEGPGDDGRLEGEGEGGEGEGGEGDGRG